MDSDGIEPSIPYMPIRAAALAYVATLPAAFAAALSIAGRVPREPSPAPEFGEFAGRRLLAYAGLLQALETSDPAVGSDELFSVARQWEGAVASGRIQTVSPLGIGVEAGDGVVGKLNSRIGALLFDLRRSAETALEQGHYSRAADFAGVGVVVAGANAESTYFTLRRSLTFEQAFAKIADRLNGKLGGEDRRKLAARFAVALGRRPDAVFVAYQTQARHTRLDLASGRPGIDPVAGVLYGKLASACAKEDPEAIDRVAERARRLNGLSAQLILEARLARTVVASMGASHQALQRAASQLSTTRPSTSS